MGYQYWTQEEIEQLQELAGTHTAAEVAGMIGSDTERVRHKAWNMGIQFGRKGKPGVRNKSNQLCWGCKWSTGLGKKCPWTWNPPILPEGCKAKKARAGDIETYAITQCPLFLEG